MNNIANTNQIIVNFFLSIFVFITILIVFLLILYYSTPNNYIITPYDKLEYNFDNEIDFEIQSNSEFKLDYDKYYNKFIKFDTDTDTDTNLTIQNIFKSQNVICDKNKLIQSRYYSDIIISNPTNKNINIKIFIYLKK